MKPKVVRGPVFDGNDIVRLIEDDGWVWAELWEGPERGWTRGRVDVGTVMSAHAYPSRGLLEGEKVPLKDWPAHVQ